VRPQPSALTLPLAATDNELNVKYEEENDPDQFLHQQARARAASLGLRRALRCALC
jgi:hypothetical protein